MLPNLTTDLLLVALILGSYGFTWAIFRHLAKQINEILLNHLVHQREDFEKLEKKVDAFIEAYYKRRQSPS